MPCMKLKPWRGRSPETRRARYLVALNYGRTYSLRLKSMFICLPCTPTIDSTYRYIDGGPLKKHSLVDR